MTYAFWGATLLSVYAAALRLPNWKARPLSRPMTLALLCFAAYCVLRVPGVRHGIDDLMPIKFLPVLLGDLFALLAFASLALWVVRLSGWSRWVPTVYAVYSTAMVAITAMFFASEAPRSTQHVTIITELNGWTLPYSATVGVFSVGTGVLLLTAIALHADMNTKADRITITLLRIGSVFMVLAGLGRVARSVHPSLDVPFFNAYEIPIRTAVAGTFAVYAIVNHYLQKRDRKVAA